MSQLTDVDRGNMVGIMLKAAIDIGIIYLKRFMVKQKEVKRGEFLHPTSRVVSFA